MIGFFSSIAHHKIGASWDYNRQLHIEVFSIPLFHKTNNVKLHQNISNCFYIKRHNGTNSFGKLITLYQSPSKILELSCHLVANLVNNAASVLIRALKCVKACGALCLLSSLMSIVGGKLWLGASHSVHSCLVNFVIFFLPF